MHGHERETWRGQALASQCDRGCWNQRFMVGAFEEATRLIMALVQPHATTDAPPVPNLLLTRRPAAGAVLAIRTSVGQADGPDAIAIQHQMIEDYSGLEVATARVLLPGSAHGPLTAPTHPSDDGPFPTLLGAVNSWECDLMNHLNVQFYAARLGQIEAALSAHLGIDPGALDGPTLAPIEHRIRFSGELCAGRFAAARTTARVDEQGMLLARTDLRDALNGAVSATFESKLACHNATTKTALPSFVALRLAAATRPIVADKARQAAIHSIPDAEVIDKLAPTHRDEVSRWEVDHRGFMANQFLYARAATAAPYLMTLMGLDRTFLDKSGYGRAAVDYTVRYERRPRIGDCLEMRSGVSAVGERSWRLRHVVRDVADHAVVCTLDSVLVLFDLTSRRAAQLPPDIREKARRLMTA